LDAASLPAKAGGAAIGRNPTDRGKPGSKRHLVVDRQGIPLAVLLTAANVHDSTVLEAALDVVPPIRQPRGRPRRRPKKLHADKAYDFRRCRRACRKRGIIPRIARRGVESSQRLGRHRWVVERTLSWIARFRRLTIRYERRAEIHLAFHPRLHRDLLPLPPEVLLGGQASPDGPGRSWWTGRQIRTIPGSRSA
jgi:IS5 family transposase